MRLTFLDFFSGIGGFRRGMELAGHTCLGHCEIDKYANMSYAAMHNPKEDEWFGTDITITRADELPRADCWCFGFPCQDISIAGKQLGFRGNRSSLFFTVTRLIRDTKEEDRPKYLFIENVKNLLSVNGGYDFLKLLIELDEIGYDAEWQVLNSKDFGVPQNRERVFIIGHLRGAGGRKVFPIGGKTEKANIEIVGTTDIRTFTENKQKRNIVLGVDGICNCLSATDYKQPKQIIVKGVLHIPGQDCIKRVYGREGISPSLNSMQGGNRQPKILVRAVLTPDRLEKRQNGRRFKADGEPMFTLTAQDRHGVAIKEATKKGYDIAYEGDGINLEQPNSKTRRGRVGKGIANTLNTSCNQGVLEGYKVRKLTPKECFRLQGWSDDYFERAASVCSDSQLYKQAGNGVTVTVIYEIAKKLN
ncbi:DNA cytosine methyltransferase [Clostridium culturomicium]|nr:DNA (cytosine-5-)-methyltransferase [Clostridium culturomicium]